MRTGEAERGSIAVLVPVLAVVVLLLAGLVLDGGRQLTARARAVAYAEEAARAGAAAVDLEQQDLALLPDDVVAARVNGYCRDAAAAGAPIEDPGACFVRVEPAADPPHRRVVVVARVSTHLPSGLLGMVGVRELTADGEGKARPYQGLDDTEKE